MQQVAAGGGFTGSESDVQVASEQRPDDVDCNEAETRLHPDSDRYRDLIDEVVSRNCDA